MFEADFNIKFNLIKAYADLGLSDDNRELMASIYGVSTDEYNGIIAEFEKTNRDNAEKVLAAYEEKHGAFRPDDAKQWKIAYLGDSNTSDRESHMNIVREILKDCANIDIGDFSVSGYKSADLFTQYYPAVPEFCPDIAVLMIGTNDMRTCDDEYGYNHLGIEEFKRNTDYLIAKLTSAGAQVIVCTTPVFDMDKVNVFFEGLRMLFTEETRKTYDEAIVSVAEKYDATLVDMRGVYSANSSVDLTIYDGLHLSPEGQALLAGQVFQELAGMLGPLKQE